MSVQTTYLDFNIIFKLGLFCGMFLLSYFYNTFLMLLQGNKLNGYKDFIIKNKLMQKYEDYLIKEKEIKKLGSYERLMGKR